MPKIIDNAFDLTITSPPYDNLRTYNGSLEWGEHIWKPVIRELYRVTKDGGVVVWIVGDATINGNETGTSFKQALYFKECGFNLHDTMIYHKPQIKFNRFGHKKYPGAFEYMFVLTKGKINSFNLICDSPNKTKGKMSPTVRGVDGQMKPSHSQGRQYKEIGCRNNVWEYFTGANNSTTDKIAYKHPAIFPEKLATDHILSWSNEGDYVFDPFAGSGTTAIACMNTNRNYFCIEKDETYYKLMCERVKNHAMK